eukprot:scaffold17665_cov61-Phaeocystis_antarctica.AAC.6
MPLNAAIQRIQRLMGFNGVITDGAGGSAQTDLSNLVGPAIIRAEFIFVGFIKFTGGVLTPNSSRVVAFIFVGFIKFTVRAVVAVVVKHGVPWRSGVEAAPEFRGRSERDHKRARAARSRTGCRPRGGGDGSALSTVELRASALGASSLPLGCLRRACNRPVATRQWRKRADRSADA